MSPARGRPPGRVPGRPLLPLAAALALLLAGTPLRAADDAGRAPAPPPAESAESAESTRSAQSAESAGPLARGAAALSAGGFEQAIDAYREALKADPESRPAIDGLAQAWTSLADARLRDGRLRPAREALEEAVAVKPESAELHRLLAQALFREGELREARREVDAALELAPENGAALELSGDIHDRTGDLSRAVADWEAAAKSGGSHALAEKAARGRTELTVEEGMRRESSRYFTVLFEPEVPRELVQGFFKVLDQAFDVLHDRLGEYPRDPIVVLLYSRVAFRDVTRAPLWSGGLYDGKIRMPVGGLRTVEQAAGLLGLLVHEMTHAFLFRMAPEGLPRWFHEGLATEFQGWDPEAIRAAFAEHPPQGLTTLAAVDRALLGGGDVGAAYAAARLALADLEDDRGFGAVRRIIAGVGEGRPFAEVFEEEMRTSLPEFEQRWSRELR